MEVNRTELVNLALEIPEEVLQLTQLYDHWVEHCAMRVGAEQLNTVDSFALSQKYPNPFNDRTVFTIQLPQSEHIILLIN